VAQALAVGAFSNGSSSARNGRPQAFRRGVVCVKDGQGATHGLNCGLSRSELLASRINNLIRSHMKSLNEWVQEIAALDEGSSAEPTIDQRLFSLNDAATNLWLAHLKSEGTNARLTDVLISTFEIAHRLQVNIDVQLEKRCQEIKEMRSGTRINEK